MAVENTVAVVLSQNDIDFNDILVKRIIELSPTFLVVVINNSSPARRYQIENVIFINTGKNLGAAGGFSRGISEALLLRPEFIWTCDDDAIPVSSRLLLDLKNCASDLAADVTSPAIVSSKDPERLAFPFRKFGRRLWKCSDIENFDFILGQAHLFNGTLFRASIFTEIGFPDPRLFIRGDEREFVLRIKKRGFKVLTVPKLKISHPTGEDELYPTCFGLLNTPIPQSKIKYSYYIRNRGYIVRRFHRIDWLLIDFIRYFSFFIFHKNCSFEVFAHTLSIYVNGLSGAIDEEMLIDEEVWLKLMSMISKRQNVSSWKTRRLKDQFVRIPDEFTIKGLKHE